MPAAAEGDPGTVEDWTGKPFWRNYFMYIHMSPGQGMSGVGGGKKSAIAGCDWANGRANWGITTHEMGHALDLAHTEMWANHDTNNLYGKDPGASNAKNGGYYTEYMDYWSTMGKGIDWQEADKIRMGWITEFESKAFMRADRHVAQETLLTLYPVRWRLSAGLHFLQGRTCNALCADTRAVWCTCAGDP